MVWFFYDTFDHSSVDQQWQDIADAVGEELAAMKAGYKNFSDFLATCYEDLGYPEEGESYGFM